MVGLKTKEESPCFRDHVVFPSLPCGLSSEDQLCMSFQESRLIFAFFSSIFILFFDLVSCYHRVHICPCKIFTGKTLKANWQMLVF